MAVKKKKLPIGIENFEKIRKEGFYYTDKTGLINELLTNWGEVNLFTRPRRFGKSLNMQMLRCFFSPDTDKSIFDGLEIARDAALCEQYMGKFPVVFVSLKGINGETYETARDMAVQVVREEARCHQYLLDSKRLTSYDKEVFLELLGSGMEEAVLCGSLKLLSELLRKHYGQKAVLLIDEYDVPLAKAFERGYYDRMLILIQNLFGQALKTNDDIQFAVLTGCMRISKESIFTGLNNLKVLSITDVRFDEFFGFTDREVRELLAYYGLSGQYPVIKEWYDGYRFGRQEVYCPWDVVCYCDQLLADPGAKPQNYWINTSSNDAVRRFIKMADRGPTRREIESLVAGEVIEKKIRQELTYKDMYDSVENLWGLLFTTGYLTQRGEAEGNGFCLAIPNREIRTIFTEQIMEYFRDTVQRDGEALNRFCESLRRGDAKGVEESLGGYLKRTISIRDDAARHSVKESFYHGILLGILGFKDGWSVYSNKESGEGYGDILVETDGGETGIVLEVKYARDGDLEAGCRKALEQIEKKKYGEFLRDEGVDQILAYGIACYKRRCKVTAAQGQWSEGQEQTGI